jgi:hypothetical protein
MSGSKAPAAGASVTVSTLGYSGKPLWQKLGLKPALRVRLERAPAEYWAWCGFDPASIERVSGPRATFDFGHLFVSTRDHLESELGRLAAALDRTGMLWVSWPKQASGRKTDVTEHALREAALLLGLFDVKVYAVSAVWSGLKFVWRREHR